MTEPILAYRAWRIAKPRREMIERGHRPGRVEAPRGVVPVPEVDAWLAVVRKARGPRYLTVQPEVEPGTLLSMSYIGQSAANLAWSEPGEVRFRCIDGPHDRPAWDCQCGLYASLTPQQAWRLISRRDNCGDFVLGAVVCRGHIIVHGIEGLRAETARIVALSAPPDPAIKGRWAARVAARLGVPCVPFDRLEQVGMEFGQPIRWKYVLD